MFDEFLEDSDLSITLEALDQSCDSIALEDIDIMKEIDEYGVYAEASGLTDDSDIDDSDSNYDYDDSDYDEDDYDDDDEI